jgi:hypothetical protein
MWTSSVYSYTSWENRQLTYSVSRRAQTFSLIAIRNMQLPEVRHWSVGASSAHKATHLWPAEHWLSHMAVALYSNWNVHRDLYCTRPRWLSSSQFNSDSKRAFQLNSKHYRVHRDNQQLRQSRDAEIFHSDVFQQVCTGNFAKTFRLSFSLQCRAHRRHKSRNLMLILA